MAVDTEEKRVFARELHRLILCNNLEHYSVDTPVKRVDKGDNYAASIQYEYTGDIYIKLHITRCG